MGISRNLKDIAIFEFDNFCIYIYGTPECEKDIF
jgi:hypothetical protein